MNKFVVSILERLYKNCLLPGKDNMCNNLYELTNFRYKVYFDTKSTSTQQIYMCTNIENGETINILFNMPDSKYVKSIECK